MKAVLLLLGLLVISCTAIDKYNPGATVMVKDWLIFNIKDIIVPDIMEEFKQIKLPDIGYNETHYELMIYDMETDIVPLDPKDIDVKTDEAQNTLSVTINNFHVEFLGNAMARFYFLHAHGECVLDATIKTVSFTIAPKLREVNDTNAIDYDLKNVDLKAGDIEFKKLEVGIIPESILKPLVNVILEGCTFVFNEFSGILDTVIVKVVDRFKYKVPSSVEIPNTPFSISVSFPDVPHFDADRIEVPIDGTLYITSDGYKPHTDDKSLIPAYDPEDQNNLQVHLHEYVMNTALSAVQKSGAYLLVDKDFIKPLKLPIDIMTTTYVGHLFPKTVCKYGKDKEMSVHVGIKEHDDSSFHFGDGKIYGDLIPMFTFFVGKEEAFSFDIKFNLDINVNFKLEGNTTTVTGAVNTLSLTDPHFTAKTVPSSDLPDIINKFEPMASAAATEAINKVLDAGVEIPVVELFEEVFTINLEKVFLEIKDKFIEVSFTIDVEP